MLSAKPCRDGTVAALRWRGGTVAAAYFTPSGCQAAIKLPSRQLPYGCHSAAVRRQYLFGSKLKFLYFCVLSTA
jgi:hypothetical protein